MGATFLATGAFGEPSTTGGTIPKGLNQTGEPDTSNFVPDGEVWEIHVASVGQTSAGTYTGLTCSLHVERDLGPGQGIHLFAITGMREVIHGTPFLALERRILLLPKMRLGVRFNSPPAGLSVSLMAYGFKYPLADLDRLLLSGGGSSTSPDFSALTLAASGLQDAASALLAAIPP